MFSTTYRHPNRRFHSISFQNYGARHLLRLKSVWLDAAGRLSIPPFLSFGEHG
jgi:hypothetical protein